MFSWIGQKIDWMMDHYVASCLFLALFILLRIGVGDICVVSMLGLLLCAAGAAQQSACADPWIIFPLMVYNLFSMASSFAAHGNIADGYGVTHLIFSTIYLLMACLKDEEQLLVKRLCVVWAGVGALAGIGRFVYRALAQGSAGRMGGLLGNPNAMGIFLVLGWFALGGFLAEGEKNGNHIYPGLLSVEPALLAALALTLSMGSFTAMAAGICVLAAGKKREAVRAHLPHPLKETFRYVCRILAKASLGIGCGMLLYLAAARTDVPGLCLVLLVYLVFMALCWKQLEEFLEAYPWMAGVISACGVFVAAAAVIVRPSAIATFAERMEMMENGLHYLTQSPLLGVGPYRWRFLNLADSDKYFNTWHIHNVLLHVGVELGWAAMAMLAVLAARVYGKKGRAFGKAEFTAFCAHNLMDTGFFYLGITSFVLLTVGTPGSGGKKAGGFWLKAFFGVSALIYAYGLYFGIK